MSRIHEALKRAAQERSTQLVAGLEAQVVGVAGEIRRSVTETSNVAGPAAPFQMVAAGSPTVPLSYKALVMRCARPEWRLDPPQPVCRRAGLGRGGAVRVKRPRCCLHPFGRGPTVV